jgi:hypothetical protein
MNVIFIGCIEKINFYYFLLKTVNPRINAIRNNTINIENKTLATDAAPSAIPVNPNIAATIAIMKKVADHLSIAFVF